MEPQLTPILAELSQRASQAEYNRLLRNIEGSFCAERAGLILPFVRQHVSKIQSSQDLQNLSRCAAVHALPESLHAHWVACMDPELSGRLGHVESGK